MARKQLEERNVHYVPYYFEEFTDEVSGEKSYKYNGKYWEKRINMDYKDCPDLF